MGLAALVLIFGTGCFELETEVRFFEDGSGFVTQWARFDLSDVAVASVMMGSTVEGETASVLRNLEDLFLDVQGVSLVDHEVQNETNKIVLRYRFAFENVKSLNAFLADPALDDQLLVPAKGAFTFIAQPRECGGDYQTSFQFSPRPYEAIATFHYREIDNLPAEQKALVIEKFLSGKMRFRVVMPGKAKAHDANVTDGAGFPVYETRVFDLFTKGLKGSCRFSVPCEKGKEEQAPLPDDLPMPVTFGYTPTADELNRTARALPNFLDVLLEYDCHKFGGVKIAITFLVKAPLHGPFEFYFPILFLGFPAMETDYNVTMKQVDDDLYRYRFESKKKIKLKGKGSHYAFFGRNFSHYSFRMNLPKLNFAPSSPQGTVARTLLRVKATLPAKILRSNATQVKENEAVWVITDRMMENKITIEAVTE